MTTCKDCLKYDICPFNSKTHEKENCKYFKDKTNFVEVVRCKDCLYATKRYGHLNCIHGVSYRNSWNKPDEYCSHGVRKD